MVPPLLSSFGWIYSTGLVTTTACGGAIAILLPLGMARGGVSSLQLFLVEEGRVKHAVEEASMLAGTPTAVLENPNLLWETMTFGSGRTGQLFRTVASPFLPSTAQMLRRMQESVDAQHPESKVLAAAANGLVEGFLQDKKDTITMFGVLGYGALLGAGLGLDYTYRHVDDGRLSRAYELWKKKQKAEETWQERKQQMRDLADKFIWKNFPAGEGKEGLEALKDSLEDFGDTLAESKDAKTIMQEKKQVWKEAVHTHVKEAAEESKQAAKTVLRENKQQLRDTADKWIDTMTGEGETTLEEAREETRRIAETMIRDLRLKDAARKWLPRFGEAKDQQEDSEESM